MMKKENRILITLVYAQRVLKRNIKVFYKLYKSNLVINFIEPLLFLFAFGVGLGNYVENINGMSYIRFIAPGIVAYSGLFAAAFECLYGSYVRMVHQKTFDAILATPVSPEGLILGEIFYAATKATLFGAIIIIVVYAAGLIHSALLPVSLLFIFLGGMTFGSMSMVVTSLVKGIESFNYYVTLVISPLMLLSGIFFPLSGWLAKISVISPFYQTAQICQLLAAGKLSEIGSHAFALTLMTAVTLTAALVMMKRRLTR